MVGSLLRRMLDATVSHEEIDVCGEGIKYLDSQTCYCFIGWSGPKCTNQLNLTHPKAFMYWRVIFAIASCLFLIYSGYTIFKSRTKVAAA